MSLAETINDIEPRLIEVALDLPFPPSVNRIWRQSAKAGKNKVRLAGDYIKWKEAADIRVLVNKTWRRVCIHGYFEAHIALNREIGRWGDLDNRIKAVLDWAQSRALVTNDKNCRLLTVEWTAHAFAPDGCRLTLRELASK